VAIGDLFGIPMTYTCLLVFQTLGQFRRCTQLLALSTGLRLIAALVLWGFTTPTAVHWAYLYAASSAVVLIYGLVAVSRYASPHFQLDLVVPSLREGFSFATSIASQSIYGDIDKTMLARLSTVEATAIYAVAYRFLDAALLPIRSLAEATYPEFFRQGTQGVTSAFGFARRILRRSVIYGLGTTIALFLGAGLVQFVLGRAWAESAAALRWLCPLALVHSLQAFLRDTLTGANYQWQRTSLDIGMAAFNVLINLWIIRAYAWRGAAWSSLMTDSLLTVLLFIIIRRHLKRERIAANSATTAQPVQPMFVTGGQ
jgi:O-antigen/teichoic acid export membrane protein